MWKLPSLKRNNTPRRRIPKKSFKDAKKDSRINPFAGLNIGGTNKAVSLLKAFFVLLVIVLLLFGLISGFSILKLKSLSSLQIGEGDLIARNEWDGHDNLNILLLGVDRRENGLMFIDSIQLLYLQPGSEQVNIFAIDPDLSVTIVKEQDTFGESTKTIYNYRQLFNYYLSQDQLNGTDSAFEDFVFALEAELGVSIDRYFQLDKNHFNDLFEPFFRLKVDDLDTSKILDVDGQFEFYAKKSEDRDSDLVRQNEAVKQYLLNLDNPYISFRYAMLVVGLSSLDDIVFTDISGQELWQIYKFLRGLNKYAITSDYTAESQKYIYLGEKFLDKKLFDDQVRTLFFDQSVVEEQARLDVINGSSKNGLAASTKRILTNHSFSIVRTDNADEVYTRNTLYVPEPEKYPKTIHKLQLFYPDLEIRQEDYPYRPTGDMVLVVI